MDVENQVCSFELSNKLLTIGVKKNSLFYWVTFKNTSSPVDCRDLEYKIIIGEWEKKDYNERSYLKDIKFYPAFTVAELGNILPNYVLTKDAEPFNGFRIFIEKFLSVEDNHTKNNWVINYYCDSVEIQGEQAFVSKKLTSNIYDPNLADAMAKMLIYLIEKGIWLFAPQSRVGD